MRRGEIPIGRGAAVTVSQVEKRYLRVCQAATLTLRWPDRAADVHVMYQGLNPVYVELFDINLTKLDDVLCQPSQQTEYLETFKNSSA